MQVHYTEYSIDLMAVFHHKTWGKSSETRHAIAAIVKECSKFRTKKPPLKLLRTIFGQTFS
jgi:hypothetical protein